MNKQTKTIFYTFLITTAFYALQLITIALVALLLYVFNGDYSTSLNSPNGQYKATIEIRSDDDNGYYILTCSLHDMKSHPWHYSATYYVSTPAQLPTLNQPGTQPIVWDPNSQFVDLAITDGQVIRVHLPGSVPGKPGATRVETLSPTQTLTPQSLGN